MIQAKNCDNFSKFVEVTEKNTIGPFFWTRVFLYALPANVPSELRHPADPQESHDKKRSSTTKGTLYPSLQPRLLLWLQYSSSVTFLSRDAYA